jgi:hypothetical protein
MPKRARETTDYGLAPQPLKRVPLHLEKSTRAAGFTVGDLVVVLDQMQTLFKTGISLTGPFEGSIELCDIPTTSWISEHTKKQSNCNGNCTELRLHNWQESPALKTAQQALLLCKYHREEEMPAIVQGADDTVEAVRKRLEQSKYVRLMSKRLPEGTDAMALLDEPFVLNLRANYPTYTWPQWAFGALEGFVARRIQLRARA